MLNHLLFYLEFVEDLFWTYGGVPALLFIGLYLTYKSSFFQITKLPKVCKTFIDYMSKDSDGARGVNPIHVFFASIGGCVGIGNVVGVCTAVQVGGPGAVFWMWIAGLFGMLVKYAEIYLGMVFRVKDDHSNGYVGGPMVYLQQLRGGKILSKIVAILLCFYGVEIYMFKIMTHSMVAGWGFDKSLVIMFLLFIVLIVGEGGVRLVGKISSAVIPLFLFGFASMSLWIFALNIHMIPSVFKLIITSAFTPHAAVGAFAGSSVMLSLSHGIRRACYTGDIGIGYASTIHSETSEVSPGKQASLGIIAIIIDTFIICTLSVLLVLVTGTWHAGIHEAEVVAVALGKYFSHIDLIWPMFIFLLGYSSLIAFYSVGRKAAIFLIGDHGRKLYPIFAGLSFLLVSNFGEEQHALMIMSIVGTLLLMINLYGLVSLLDRVKFDLKD